MLHLALKRRLLVECNVVCREDLHVGMSAADLPSQCNPVNGPFIPGSGLRGAFRSHLHRLLASIEATDGAEAKKILGGERVAADDETEKNFTRASENKKGELFKELGIIDKLFGFPGFASPLRFTDAHPVKDVKPYRRTHVALDIGTDRAKERALLDIEAMPTGSEFAFKMIFDELSDERMKVANRIFYMFLKSLAENGVEMFLGGWKSRGYGLCEVKAIKLEEYTPITLVRGGPPQTYQREKIAQFIDRVLEELEEAR